MHMPSQFTKGRDDFNQRKYPQEDPQPIRLPWARKGCTLCRRLTDLYIKILFRQFLSLRVLSFSQLCIIMKFTSYTLFALLASLVHAAPIPHEEVSAIEHFILNGNRKTHFLLKNQLSLGRREIDLEKGVANGNGSFWVR